MQIQIWWLILVLALLGTCGVLFIWLIVRLNNLGGGTAKTQPIDYESLAKEDVDHIFNDEFREELRNMGRLHFQKVLGENAMFLQQDLQYTTSQLNEYLKSEVTRRLQEEFAKYEQSIKDAQGLAIEALQRTTDLADEQRKTIAAELQGQVEARKNRMIEEFEKNMTEVINHYLLEAIGGQIDLSAQMEYIVSELEANKEAIVEDIRR